MWSTEVESLPQGNHPLIVFKEIERLELLEFRGEEGTTVDVESMSGSVGYESRYLKVYALERGMLIPLERVVFHDATWYSIGICKREHLNEISKGNMHASSSEVTIFINESNVNSSCIVAFISQDLSKAEVVEYYDVINNIVEISGQHPTVKKIPRYASRRNL